MKPRLEHIAVIILLLWASVCSAQEVLEFSASWCAPCQRQKPVVESLIKSGLKIRPLDFDSERTLASKLGVNRIPAFVALDASGKVVGRATGIQTAEQIKSLCNATEACGLPLGSVLVSRNLDEKQNHGYGHWNHLAIVVSSTELVEAQADRGVIRTPLAEYLTRPYAPPLALLPCDRAAGIRAARKAESYVGLPYSKLGSVLRMKARQLQRGERPAVNCVVPVKAAYWSEDVRVRRLKIPDGALKLEGLFDAPRPLSELLEHSVIKK